jgi:DNA-binding response OmpR family regulator
LLLTDVVMPRLSGRELAERVRAIVPDVSVLYMSGYPDAKLDGPESPRDSLLYKPFHVDELLTRVRDALDSHPPSAPTSGAHAEYRG